MNHKKGWPIDPVILSVSGRELSIDFRSSLQNEYFSRIELKISAFFALRSS